VAAITSTANPRVKALARLRSRRERDRVGATLIEGHDELQLALAAGVLPSELWWSPTLARPEQHGLLAAVRSTGAEIVEVSPEVFQRVAYRESPDGWLALAPSPGRPLTDLRPGPNCLVLVAEGIEKPGNLGALFRTAEAFGADAVISASGATDLGNPNVVRASKATVFSIAVAAAPTAEVIAFLRDYGIRIVVTTPAGTKAPAEVELTGPTALVIGAESTGVTSQWLAAADDTVVIPMHGQVNSLNAAAAGAITLYEANRQRAR